MFDTKQFLKTHFGYDAFRPLQEDIIASVLAKKDVCVLMPTGGGKSLCYQLPALAFDGVTLVVSPLIALMKDQVDVLKGNGINAEYINSSLSSDEISDIQKRAQNGDVKILYLAPERLAMDNFLGYLSSLNVSLIAIDEAHCISEWGHDFRPDYRNLKQLKQHFSDTPIIALTATATQRVREDIVTQLALENPQEFISSFDRENLSLIVIPKRQAYKKVTQLLERHKNESAIIYCFSRKDTEALAMDLSEDGFKALPYHAGLDPETRKKNQEQFIKDEVDIVVATIAFGMGIDKPDVRLIIHHTFPKTLEGYYQEIGRAGRDGLPAECVTLYSYGDTRKHEFFFEEIEEVRERENAERKLKQAVEYFESAFCRRKHILKYFGEEYQHASLPQADTVHQGCGSCDVCLQPRETFDATEIAQKILSCVIRTESRFGKKYIADVLRGKETEQVIRNRHHMVSTFGIASDHSADQIKSITSLLVSTGYLQTSEGKYPTLSLTSQGMGWLTSKKPLELPRMKEFSIVREGEPAAAQELEYDQGLFSRLRSVRKQLADERGVPPFVIFGDRSLREMAHFIPQDQSNFSRITGVGVRKLEDLGEMFIKVIQEYAAEHRLKPKDIPDRHAGRSRRNQARKSTVALNDRYQKTKEMIKQKKSLSEIAEVHGFTKGTIINHIEKLIQAGEDVDIDYLTPTNDDMKNIKRAFDARGTEALKPVYDFLQEKYSYEVIKLVRVLLTVQ